MLRLPRSSDERGSREGGEADARAHGGSEHTWVSAAGVRVSYMNMILDWSHAIGCSGLSDVWTES